MRKVFALLLGLSVAGFVNSQSLEEFYSYGFDEYIEKCTDLPIVRTINGGTVFRVTYEGDWTNEMKGAFEYACKIWEEQLPTTLPLNVTAKIGAIRAGGNQKLLSKVNNVRYSGYDTFNDYLASISCQIKSVVLTEYNRGNIFQFKDSIRSADFFEEPDITITYNEDLLDEFSFSLYATPVDKYDFVTVVLRDIAKGLGLSATVTADVENQRIINSGKSKTPYEYKVYAALGNGDASQAYINATKGSLSVNVTNYGTLKLYAPSPFQNGISLNAYVPDPTKKITELLTYEFGRGSVIRDISDNYEELFKSGLNWNYMIATGGAADHTGVTKVSTDDVVPYGGTITEGNSTRPFEFSANAQSACEVTVQNEDPQFSVEGYCWPYDYNYRPDASPDEEGWTVALLKKDGTWDIVYDMPTIPSYLDVSMDRFKFHDDINNYARTCDGYLRCRVTYNQLYPDGLYGGTYRSMKVKYYVLDYLPQRTDLAFSGVIPATSTRALANEYMRDIKIGIKNLEGTERIIVEQLDEGERIPSKFEVSDFKKGYFIATVDKEFYSEFTIVAYNKNGGTRSETIEIAPLEPAKMNFDVNVYGEKIDIKNMRNRESTKTLLSSYEIVPLNDYSIHSLLRGNINGNNASIDISSLQPGNYVLNYYDFRGRKESVKFRK